MRHFGSRYKTLYGNNIFPTVNKNLNKRNSEDLSKEITGVNNKLKKKKNCIHCLNKTFAESNLGSYLIHIYNALVLGFSSPTHNYI